MTGTIPAPFRKGVNFTGWLEYRPADEIREDMFTKKDFENVKSMGGDVVRVPIHFERFVDREDSCRIDGRILGIIDRLEQWSKELGMYIILDFHNSTHVDSVTPEDVEEILTPVWTQLAERYRGKSEYLVYELMNEPHGIEIGKWNGIVERLHRKIRGIDPDHWIVIGGADWNSTAAMKQLPDFGDDRVIYTFHFYEPHTFTHQGAPWCHMERVVGLPFPYDPEKMPPLPENPTEREMMCFRYYEKTGTVGAIERFFDDYAEFSNSRKAPVFCGEFGCNGFAVDPEQRVRWYRIVTKLLDERGIARTSWDYFGGFGIFGMNPGQKMHIRHLMRRLEFPQDLNREIVEALGFRVPPAE